MSDTSFSNNVTLSDSDWFNDVNRLHYTILGDPADVAAVKSVIGPTSGTVQATTSGTSKDFTIPSWAKRITGNLAGVSTNGSSNIMVQLGDAGGIEASGYLMSVTDFDTGSTVANNTVGFALTSVIAAASVLHGRFELELVDAATNTWAFTSRMGLSNVAGGYIAAGSKATSQALTTVRLTTVNGTDAFDAGSFNILYE